MTRPLRIGALALARVLALGLAGAAAAQSPEAAAATGPRHIVVLVADDWGFSDVGAFGGEIATPNLDELARRGMRFANFHVAASCAPTRAMLLTGVDNHRNGVGNLRETMPRAHLGQPGYLGSLSAKVVTLATLLQASGYRTSIAGKWNVGNEPHNLPDRRGFDRSIVQGDTGSDNWEPAKRYLPHAAQVNWFEDGRPAVMPAEFYSSAYFIDRTLEHLGAGAASGKPFFAYVGFQANHVPLQAPPEFIAKYRGRYDAGWTALRQARRDRAAALGLIPQGAPMVTMAASRNWATLSPTDRAYQARLMEVYAGMAEAMDHQVGRLIGHLKQTGEFDRTVFVFLSDNGPEGSDYAQANFWLRTQYSREFDRLGGKGAYAVPGPSWSSASASPLAGFKFYAGEGGIRTPLIISGVPGMAQNQVHAGLTHVTDLLPTLLAVAGVARPGNTWQGQAIEPPSGHSLLPVLADPAARVRSADEALGYELAGSRALFKADWKIVQNQAPMGDGQWHLHDLRTDPGETRDLQAQQPQVFQALQAEYAAWASAQGVLDMPEGYNPVRQVMINTLFNHWWPAYRLPGLLLLAGLVAGLVWLRRRRPAG